MKQNTASATIKQDLSYHKVQYTIRGKLTYMQWYTELSRNLHC